MIKRFRSKIAPITHELVSDSSFICMNGKKVELNNDRVKEKMKEIVDKFANEPILIGPLASKKLLENVSISIDANSRDDGGNDGKGNVTRTFLKNISIISNQDINTFVVSLIDQKFIKNTCSAIDSSDKNIKAVLDTQNPTRLFVTFPKLTIETKNSMAKQETLKSEHFRKELRILRQEIVKEIQKLITDYDTKRKSELDLERLMHTYTELVNKALNKRREEILK